MRDAHCNGMLEKEIKAELIFFYHLIQLSNFSHYELSNKWVQVN